MREGHETPSTPVLISGCIGPRGDGYQVGTLMTVDEARTYHAVQTRSFAASEADLVTASTMIHAELDEAETLDTGDPAELAERYRELRAVLPELRVLGGCCGTNHPHLDAIATACAAGVASS